MLRQSLFAIIASILVILFIVELNTGLMLLEKAHLFVAQELAKVFAGGHIGIIIRNTIALFLIPFLIAFIPAIIYWTATRSHFKYFTPILWISWIVVATLLVVK